MNSFDFVRKNKILDNLVAVISNFFFLIVRIISRNNKSSENKVLIISLHKIGDSIFTLPAIKSLIEHFTTDKINLLVYEEVKEVFEYQLNVKKIYTLTKSNLFLNDRIADRKSRKLIREINPGIIIDLTGTILSASLIFNSSAKNIIGLNEKYFRNVYSDFIPIRKKPHLIERYCDVAELIMKRKVDKNYFEYPINYNKDGEILIHPFAGWQAKEWGLKRFISLTEKLSSDNKAALIFPKKYINYEVLSYLKQTQIKFIETESISDLINEIKKCSLFIGNDSGPLYLAAINGKPTFTIYGPTNPDYSKPFGKFHKQINKKLRCSPVSDQYCFLSAGRDCPSNECMVLLNENYIYEEIIKLINELEIRPIN